MTKDEINKNIKIGDKIIYKSGAFDILKEKCLPIVGFRIESKKFSRKSLDFISNCIVRNELFDIIVDAYPWINNQEYQLRPQSIIKKEDKLYFEGY